MERKPHIDIAKGIAMMLVLAGHVKSCPGQLHCWLYSFHMPLFFALSGITLRIKEETPFREFINKLIHRMIIPYFLLSIMLWILTKPLEYMRGADKDYIIKSFIGIFAGYRLSEYYFTMWFILVLIISEIVVFILFKYLYALNGGKKTAVYSACITVVFLLIGSYTINRFHGLPWSLDLVPFGVAFIAVGMLLQPLFGIKATVTVKNSTMLIIAFCTLMINIVCCRENHKFGGDVDLYYCHIYNAAYFAVAAISGTIFIMCISVLMKRNAVLEYTGRNTLTFYAFNNSFAIPHATAAIMAMVSGIAKDDSRIFIFVLVLSYLILAVMTQFICKYMPAAAGIKRQQ